MLVVLLAVVLMQLQNLKTTLEESIPRKNYSSKSITKSVLLVGVLKMELNIGLVEIHGELIGV